MASSWQWRRLWFLISAPLLLLPFLLLLPSHALAGEPVDANLSEKIALENEIQTLRNYLEANKNSHRNLGSQYARLGSLYQSSDVRWHNGGKYKPYALENFNRALTYDLAEDEKILVLQRKGMLLKMMSKGIEAVETHQQVLNMADVSREDAADAYVHMADAQSMMGQVPEALKSLNKASELNPNNLEVYYPMVQACKELKCRTVEEWAQLVGEMEGALLRSKNPSRQKRSKRMKNFQVDFDDDDDDDDWSNPPMSTGIYWALYEAGLKAENVSLAWSYLDLAHRIELKNRKSSFTPADESQRTALILQIFKKGFWPSGVGSSTKLPVFIVGMMRSGSTLLETILDAHPNVFGLGEDSIFNSQLPEVKDHVVKAASGSSEDVEKTVAKDAKVITSKMVAMAKEMDEDSSKGKILRVVDKMLFNYRNIGFIHLLFPQAAILHTVRDPMDTLLSCFTQKFDDKGLEWAFQPATLVEMYVDYLTIMNHFRSELPGQIMDINYEEVVRQPERVVKSLIVNKLGLPWNDSVLRFHTSNRSVHTHSMHQVRQGLYVTAIGRWVKYKAQLEPIRKLLLPHLKGMLAKGQLPYADQINWLLDPHYDYGAGTEAKTEPKTKPEEFATVRSTAPSQAVPTLTDHAAKTSVPQSTKFEIKSSKIKSSTPETKSNTLTSEESQSPKKRRRRVKSDVSDSAGKTGKRRAKTLKAKSKSTRKNSRRKIKRDQSAPETKGTYKDHTRIDAHNQKAKRAPERKRRRKTTFSSKKSRNSVEIPTLEVPSVSPAHKQSSSPKVSREYIASLAEELEGSFPPEVSHHLAVIQSSLPYHSGDRFLDNLGAISVALFNLGKLQECIQFSQQVLLYNNSLHSVIVALASALAMDGKLEESLVSMNSLINERTREGFHIGADVFERRAQVLMALGDTNSSITDLTKAIKMSPSVNSYTARANAYIREQRYWDAKKDAMSAIKLGANTAQLWSLIGRCEREFGEPEKAISALTKALQLESTHKEALLEMAVTYMSISNARKALEYLDKCLALDPLMKNAHGYKGLLLQNMGRAKDTITAFMEAYRIDSLDTQALQFIAVSYAAMGNYGNAIEWFEKTLLADPDHYSWCLREIAYYRWQMLDVPFAAYNPDTDLHWLLKDAWIRRAPLRNYCGPGRNPWCHYKLSLHDPNEVRILSAGSGGIPMEKFYNRTRRTQMKELVTLVAPISRWIQVDSPGFLKHERQHKMFGVMALQIAQQLVSHYRLVQSGQEGLRVPDSSRSRRVLVGKEEIEEVEGLEGDHIFGWRDLYDIAVKWRQVAEPFDTVLWIDCTAAQEDQADKVGLQTFLYHGMGKNIRYYPYFNKTFTLLKRLTPQGFYIGTENFSFKLPSKESLPAIEGARSLREYLDALQPLYVLTPLLSRATPQEGALEGTRIAVSPVSPKGENLYISTGTSYERYERYGRELELALSRVVEWAVQTNAPDYDPQDPEGSQAARDEGLDRCLELYYYWINFSPLSRGSAAVGYASIVACMMSFGDIPSHPLPKGVQLDWEAILTLSPAEFISVARPLLQSRTPVVSFLPPCWLSFASHPEPSCSVSHLVSTARDAIFLMNGLYEDDQ